MDHVLCDIASVMVLLSYLVKSVMQWAKSYILCQNLVTNKNKYGITISTLNLCHIFIMVGLISLFIFFQINPWVLDDFMSKHSNSKISIAEAIVNNGYTHSQYQVRILQIALVLQLHYMKISHKRALMVIPQQKRYVLQLVHMTSTKH